MSKSDYSWGIDPDGAILRIIDLNQGRMSVTNNAENVLSEIEAQGVDLKAVKIVYRDSDEQWDGINIDSFDPITISFIPIQTSEYCLAKEKVLSIRIEHH